MVPSGSIQMAVLKSLTHNLQSFTLKICRQVSTAIYSTVVQELVEEYYDEQV